MRKSTWIAVDIDGVLADHVTHILPVLKRDHGIDVSFSQVRTWDFPVGDTTFGKILKTAQRLPEFVLTTPIVPGARDAMEKLFATYYLAIVTARPPESTDATAKWLQAHSIPFDDFANLSEGTKHRTVIPCDLLIDDYTLNVLEYLRHSKGRAILFSRPWNADHSNLEQYVTSHRLRQAANWPELLALVTHML